MHFRLFVLIPLLFSTIALADSTASNFVLGIYSNYKDKNTIFQFKGEKAESIFSKELLQLIRLDEALAQGEVGYLEGDPLCGCQDGEGLIVERITVQEHECEIYALVDLKIEKQHIKVVLKLIEHDSDWRVGDIKTDSLPSLYGFLFSNLMEDLLSSKDE